jgi:hypothetical protein
VRTSRVVARLWFCGTLGTLKRSNIQNNFNDYTKSNVLQATGSQIMCVLKKSRIQKEFNKNNGTDPAIFLKFKRRK